jgi:hypothetical protein
MRQVAMTACGRPSHRRQLALEDLARRSLGQAVPELDDARVLVRREPLLAVGDDLLAGHAS